jgi:pseudaminic acid biosynthesis-associated methylase
LNEQGEQLVEAWKGGFGNEYISRNRVSPEGLRARTRLWAEILQTIQGVMPESILEVGANVGGNLMALRQLTNAELFAVEPNPQARQEMADTGVLPAPNIREGHAAAIELDDASVDFAFTCGVLIHVHPDELLASCREIHRVSGRYIACVEYFADQPETIKYQGETGMLFKRDFGAYWLEHFPDLKPMGYGFSWKPISGLDNMNWWIFEKP